MPLQDSVREHRTGFVMTLFGVLLISPDSLIVRIIDADSWTMVFWRGVLIGVTFLGFIAFRYGASAIRNSLRLGGRSGVGVALCYTSTAIGFMSALHLTSVANTLVILAASPFFSAILSRVILREAVAWQTWLAIIAGFCGIGVVMLEGLLNTHVAASWQGDLCALAASLSLAGSFVFIRQRRSVNMIPAMAIGGLLSAVIAVPFAAPLALEGAQIGWTALLCIVVLPLSFGLIALGPRRIPAPEVSLLMLLETILGPIWVWFFLGEEPGLYALIGAAIVLTSLAVHSAWRLTRGSGKTAVPTEAEIEAAAD
ncbi:DMT family transporter [Rhodospirillaceae bacterium KN72]|uniref:DMT family transporter n=1 Tax=Pacificispira spongiicola TaxID=2729598 RepID=A0A7Y0DWJ8_9PROT|nr:DMT family transporter [Pacificispira spongiicola]NMM42932.1 DMT family transporter [Pacificispira spongiicola]